MNDTKDRPVIIGVPIGDPNGIGPEVAAVSALDLSRMGFITLLVGDAEVIKRALSLSNQVGEKRINKVGSPEDTVCLPGTVNVLDRPLKNTAGIHPGLVSAEAGTACLNWLQEAVGFATAGRIDGIACAPANKEAMRLAGSPYSGQTAFIASLTGISEPDGKTGTVLVSGAYRVFQTTSHVPLCQICDLITEDNVLNQIRLAKRVLENDFSIPDPLLAVCGLNPHAGDGGLIGDDEKKKIIPALTRARAEGIRVDGPLPGDVVFVKVRREGHAGIVAMYHDQANAVLKFISVPVDVTLGLPIVRTTVAHGTAFDLAWQGKADAGCMKDAVNVAANLVMARRKKQH